MSLTKYFSAVYKFYVEYKMLKCYSLLPEDKFTWTKIVTIFRCGMRNIYIFFLMWPIDVFFGWFVYDLEMSFCGWLSEPSYWWKLNSFWDESDFR